MATPTPSPTYLSLKLLIDPKSNTVRFAEAGKDFVDFLFNIMELPVASIISLTSKQGTVGCTRNIYDSIENVGDSCMLSAGTKDLLLKSTGLYDPFSFLNPAYKPSYSGQRGFVKGGSTFMVMDDLVVRPMSAEYIFTLFNKFNIKDTNSLEVRVVGVGADEGLKLVRALMQSKTVLTDVFLAGKKEPSVKSEAV